MSFLINGLKSVGSGLVAIPVAIGQGALWLTSTAVSGIATGGQGALLIASATASGIAKGARGTKHMAVTTTSAARKFALETVPGAASQVATFAIEAAKESAISKAVRNDDELFYRIQIVGQKISADIKANRSLSPVNRNELAELLEEFLEIHISDVSVELRESGRKYFNRLCEKLRNPSEKLEAKDLDDLAIIVDPYIHKHGYYIGRKLREAKQLKKVPYIITQAPAKLSPAETKNRIENQMSLLKFNAIKLVAGSMLINSALGIYTFGDVKGSSVKESLQNILNNHGISYTITDQTDIVYFLIEASNKIASGKASVEIFELLINTVINHSGKSVLTRALAKIQCRFLYKLISSYVGNLMDNLKGTLVNFAELTPTEQLKKITELLVDPVVGHLESKPDPNLSPAEQIKQIILGTKLLDTFIDHFLNRFLDRFNQPWLQQSQYLCLEKAASSPHLAKAIFFQMLAGLIGLAVHTLSPIQSVMSDTVHFLLRKIIVGICPSLSDATKESLAIGTEHAWYSVKSSLLLTLQQIRLNRLQPRPEDPTFNPPKEIPAEVTQQWENLLAQLLKKLANDGIDPLTLDAKAWGELSQILIDLGKYTFSKTVTGVSLEEAKAFEARVAAFMAEHKDKVVPALQHIMNTPGILESIKATVANLALGTLAQENYINETLLVSLASINAASFDPNYKEPSKEAKEQVKEDLQKELGLLGGNIVQDISAATLKAEQTEANTIITSLKQKVAAFQTRLSEIAPTQKLSFESHAIEECTRFTQLIAQLKIKVAALDPSTQALLLPSIDEAQRHVDQISSSFSKDYELLRQQAEKELQDLPIRLTNPEGIEAILAGLRALQNPLLDLDTFEFSLRAWTNKHPSHLFLIIAKHIEKVNENAETECRRLNQQLCLENSQDFTEWANQLKFVKVSTKPGIKEAGLSLVCSSTAVQTLAGALFQSYGDKLFTFFGKEAQVAGIAKNWMKNFINTTAAGAENPSDDRATKTNWTLLV